MFDLKCRWIVLESLGYLGSRCILFAAVALMGVAACPTVRAAVQPTQHQTAPVTQTTFINTSDGVRLEVLDYGGQGSPILLVSGGGMTAHAFDKFAPRLAAHHRVFAFTRRALGQSDTPPLNPDNYTLARLTQDVVEVLDGLKIQQAALAG
ncbi:hypothetical protein BH10PSE3_BH10PSE3_30660 [soil metagenome]